MDIENILPNLEKARKRSKKMIDEISFVLKDEYKNIGLNQKYIIHTYGCQGNEADSEMMSGILNNIGYTKIDDEKKADLIIINTCAVRETAEDKIWGVVGRLKNLKEKNPNLIIAISGCMPQEEVVVKKILEKYKHIDIIFGTHNIFSLPKLIYEVKTYHKRVIEVFSEEGDIYENIPIERELKHKAWVTIMYGCDEFCTYCIIPYTRGKERSRRPNRIIDEVKDLVSKGYKEVTLLGQNVNAYGKDFKDIDYTFGDLLRDLDKTGIKRIRFTTSHPRDLDDKTISCFKDCKSVMPHLHLPVQSGSNNILKKMNRKYTKEIYLEKISKLKEARPDISITTDIIVGFPNETEEDFLETIDLVKKADFEGAFTFIYSPRVGTPAANFDDNISMEIKKERLQTLNKYVNQGYLKGNKRFLNETLEVLVDSESKKNQGYLRGYTKNNKLVNFKGDKKLIGELVNVKITDVKTWFLNGEINE